jgi:hypothetical protein
MTNINQSNSLADLAARIRTEHDAATVSMKAGVLHAIQAGALLIEAKEKLEHGQWLPWLKANCEISERTAQQYMRLARHRDEIDTKSAEHADLPVSRALRLLAKPVDLEPGSWEWAEAQLDGPFSESDAESNDIRWLNTKLLHQIETPACASMLIGMAHEYPDLSILRLCSADEIFDVLKLLAPIAKQQRTPPATSTGGAVVIVLLAERMIGMLFREIEEREKLTDAEYGSECKTVLSTLQARLDERLAELDEIKAIEDEQIKWARLETLMRPKVAA